MVRKKDRRIKCSRSLFILISSMIFVQTIFAQTTFNLSQSTSYDDNIFRNYVAASDWINQTAASLSRDFHIKSSQVRLNYTGVVTLFRNFPGHLFHQHQLGAEAYFPLSKNMFINSGLTFDFRKNQDDYEIYDFSQWLLYAHWRWEKWQKSPIQFGFQIRQKRFENLTEFSYQENTFFLRIKHFFPSRTTFIGEVNLGTKTYLAGQIVQELIITEKSNGKGNGRGKGNASSETDSMIVANNMQIPETRQLTISLQLAQSIFSTTGLSLKYLRRFQPTSDNRYLTGQEFSYTSEDELYDDHFSYGSHEGELVLTQLLPYEAQVKFLFYKSRKNYLYNAYENGILSANLRSDEQNIAGVNISKKIIINRRLESIALYLSYDYLINKSNDAYFDFEDQTIQAGIDVNF